MLTSLERAIERAHPYTSPYPPIKRPLTNRELVAHLLTGTDTQYKSATITASRDLLDLVLSTDLLTPARNTRLRDYMQNEYGNL